MRERAEAATAYDHGWRLGQHQSLGMCEVWADHDGAGWNSSMVATTLTRLNEHPRVEALSDATHIASWHPVVALAVADWLDHAADIENDDDDDAGDMGCDCPYCKGIPLAIAVARAYLGRDEDAA